MRMLSRPPWLGFVWFLLILGRTCSADEGLLPPGPPGPVTELLYKSRNKVTCIEAYKTKVLFAGHGFTASIDANSIVDRRETHFLYDHMVINGERVLYASGPVLSLVDINTGKAFWTKDTRRTILNIRMAGNRTILLKGALFAKHEQTDDLYWLQANDFDAGTLLWRKPCHQYSVIDGAGDSYYVGHSKCLKKIDARSGRLIAKLPFGDTFKVHDYGDVLLLHRNPKQQGYVLQAINSRTMKPLWSFRKGILDKCHPMQLGRKFIFSANGNDVYCLSADDGSVLWKQEGAGSTECVLTKYKEQIIVYSRCGRCLALSAKTGKVLWQVILKCNEMCSPKAVVSGNRVFLNGDNKAYSIGLIGQVSLYGAKRQQTIWRYRQEFLAANHNAGESTEFETRLKAIFGRNIPLLQGNTVLPPRISEKIVAFYEGCEKYCIVFLDRKTGKRLWWWRCYHTTASPFCIASDRVFIQAGCLLYCYSGRTGKKLWNSTEFETVVSELAARGDSIFTRLRKDTFAEAAKMES